MKKMELLAPVGDREGLEVAVKNGANAVYLGLSQFNARIRATNFTADNIAESVSYAHLHGVKVYLTVNTLIKNKEISSFLELIRCAIDAKIDAYIIQDLGVYHILVTYFKGLVLHASTQMGIHNLLGAQMAEKMGFSRVVLSRETKLADIIAISQGTKLEIEFFVQGALCVAFSGNCYLSSFATQNSGNRGRCAQLCRLKYSADVGETKFMDGYLLSTRDLCLINQLKVLQDAGVTSAKIEGRMRRTGYVAEAVNCYRKAIDSLGRNYDASDAVSRLKGVFNRGNYNYNAYLADGTPSNIINPENQNHMGVLIGKVAEVQPFKDIFRIVIESNRELHEGDGIKFFDVKKECGSMGVGNVKQIGKNSYEIFSKNRVEVGAVCSIIYDKQREAAYIANAAKPKLGINITAVAYADCPLVLTASCNNQEVKYKTDFILPVAINKATEEKELIEQLAKVGGTDFYVNNITCKMGQVFIPKSVLNAARREVLDKLTTAIINKNSKNIVSTDIASADCTTGAFHFLPAENEKPANKDNFYVFGSAAQIFGIHKNITTTDTIIIKPSAYNISNVSAIYKECAKFADSAHIALELPNIANGEDLTIIDGILAAIDCKTLLINNIYGFDYAERGYAIIAGAGLNIFNNFAQKTAEEFGAREVVVSAEQCESNYIYNSKAATYSYGRLAVMTFAHCPYKENSHNSCQSCSYKPGLKYKINNAVYPIVRRVIKNCYFELLLDAPLDNCRHENRKFMDFSNATAEEIEAAITGSNASTMKSADWLNKEIE